MKSIRFGFVAAAVAAVLAVHSAAPAEAALTKQELKCSATLAKNFSKLQSSLLKLYARCHSDDISGKVDSADGCATLPAKAQEKAEKTRTKFVAKIAKACKSVCSLSPNVECVTDMSCPAKHISSPLHNSTAETCKGKGGAAPFDLRNLDWPGPYCDAILGHPMRKTEDLGECVVQLVDSTVSAVDRALFADLDESAGLDKDGLKCLTKSAKSVAKAISKPYLAAAECRDLRRSLNDSNVPAYACSTEDPDVVAEIDSALLKMTGSIGKSCTDTAVAALTGLCADGGVTPATIAQAEDCLSDLVREVAIDERGYQRHVYSPIGMLNATHPNSAAGYCGDGLVTPKREEHTGVGEECDGDNDDACGAGSCIPKGDLFECTCDSTPRERFVVNGDTPGTDSDAGWNGESHDATHNNGFGYVLDLSNCTCDGFTQATCTTPSGNNVCDVYGNMAPRCSDDLSPGSPTCDQRGNNDGNASDADCFTCDDYSINAGTWCAYGTAADEPVCQSQCIDDETDLPVLPQTACQEQGDCGEGETCRGRCDTTITCNEMTEGSPLPLISATIPVCIGLRYKTDITGTKNIVTGETAISYTTRSLIALGSVTTQPCPVCIGVCIGGTSAGDSCYGTCDVSGDPCLFDSDCTGGGDTVCEESAVDCPGGYCSLDLRCTSGVNVGRLCRVDTSTQLGIVSHDCPPIPNDFLSGTGVLQDFGTVTTEAVEFPVGGPCSNPSWTNFDCPCPADAPPNIGVPTRPNGCAAACDGGPNVGHGCVTGNGGSGVYTECVGGTEAGAACDDNADCDGGSCTGNPLECVAGSLSKIGTACTTNANCGGGGLCDDPCPGARCVPLCYQEGVCNGGGRDGDPCATVDHCKQCTAGNASLIGAGCDKNSRCDTTSGSGDGVCAVAGGVTCDVSDPEDGLCAAGPLKFRCTGAGFTTRPCTLSYGTCSGGFCTAGSPSKRNLACTVAADCLDLPNVPVSSGCETGDDSLPGTSDDLIGAGECEPRPQDCYVNNGFAEGGDTLNGLGSPSDVKVNAAFCTPPNSNSAINDTSGFGGPSRIRREGAAYVNVPSIP